MVEQVESPRGMDSGANRRHENETVQVADSGTFLFYRNSSLDCRVDREQCVEGSAIGRYGSRKEAFEVLRDQWDKGECF